MREVLHEVHLLLALHLIARRHALKDAARALAHDKLRPIACELGAHAVARHHARHCRGCGAHPLHIDSRFRYRGGIRWFWLRRPALPLIWLSRGAIVIALLLALSTPLTGLSKSFALLLGIFLAFHILGLVLVELRESH
jgi:ABC-type nickel/cobalt efflux system permease component RcnA